MLLGICESLDEISASGRLVEGPEEICASEEDLDPLWPCRDRFALGDLLLDEHLSHFGIAGLSLGAGNLSGSRYCRKCNEKQISGRSGLS